jgi:hypothetical protein
MEFLKGMADGFVALCLVMLPLAALGVWKLIEVLVWFAYHIHWG